MSGKREIVSEFGVMEGEGGGILDGRCICLGKGKLHQAKYILRVTCLNGECCFQHCDGSK